MRIAHPGFRWLFTRHGQAAERATENFTNYQMMLLSKKKYGHGTPDGYIGIAELGGILRKSRKTLRRMVHDGRLPKPLRDGSHKIWDRKDMMRWIQNAKFTKR